MGDIFLPSQSSKLTTEQLLSGSFLRQEEVLPPPRPQPPISRGPLENFFAGVGAGVSAPIAGAVKLFDPEFGGFLQEAGEERFQTDPDRPVSSFVGKVVGSAALLAPAAVTTGGLSLALSAPALATFGFSAAQETAERLDDFEERTGETVHPAYRTFAMVGSGLVDAGLEAAGLHLGIKQIFKGSTSKLVSFTDALLLGNKGLASKLLASGVVEAGEEVSEDFAKDLIVRVVDSQAFQNAGSRYLQAAAGGAIGGGFVLGPLSAFAARGAKVDTAIAKSTESDGAASAIDADTSKKAEAFGAVTPSEVQPPEVTPEAEAEVIGKLPFTKEKNAQRAAARETIDTGIQHIVRPDKDDPFKFRIVNTKEPIAPVPVAETVAAEEPDVLPAIEPPTPEVVIEPTVEEPQVTLKPLPETFLEDFPPNLVENPARLIEDLQAKGYTTVEAIRILNNLVEQKITTTITPGKLGAEVRNKIRQLPRADKETLTKKEQLALEGLTPEQARAEDVATKRAQEEAAERRAPLEAERVAVEELVTRGDITKDEAIRQTELEAEAEVSLEKEEIAREAEPTLVIADVLPTSEETDVELVKILTDVGVSEVGARRVIALVRRTGDTEETVKDDIEFIAARQVGRKKPSLATPFDANIVSKKREAKKAAEQEAKEAEPAETLAEAEWDAAKAAEFEAEFPAELPMLEEEFDTGLRDFAESGREEDEPSDESYEEEIEYQLKVRHASKNKFEQINTAHMSEGAGGQAFGWGTYFSDLLGVVKWYGDLFKEEQKEKQRIIAKINNIKIQPPAPHFRLDLILRQLHQGKVSLNIVIDNITNSISALQSSTSLFDDEIEALSYLRTIKDAMLEGTFTFTVIDPTIKAYLYEVTLHEGKDITEYDYLSWEDNITAEQGRKIDDQLAKEGREGVSTKGEPFSYADGGLTGQEVYQFLSSEFIKFSKEEEFFGTEERSASLFLDRAGIDGMKYPVGTLSGKRTEGAFNYVVYNPEKAATIKAVEEYQVTTTGNDAAFKASSDLAQELIQPLIDSGIVTSFEVTDQQLTNTDGEPVNGLIVHNEAAGTAVMKLSRWVHPNTIGHEGAHALIRALMRNDPNNNDPYVGQLIRMFDGDFEAAADAIGDIFFDRIINGTPGSMPIALTVRVKEWLAGLWVYAKEKLGLDLTRQELLNRMVDMLSTGVESNAQSLSVFMDELDEVEYQLRGKDPYEIRRVPGKGIRRKGPFSKTRDPNAAAELDFMTPAQQQLFLESANNVSDIQVVSVESLNKDAQRFMNPKSLAAMIHDVLIKDKGLSNARFIALRGYMHAITGATADKYALAETDEEALNILANSDIVVAAYQKARGSAGRQLRLMQETPYIKDNWPFYVGDLNTRLGKKMPKSFIDKIRALSQKPGGITLDDLIDIANKLKVPSFFDLFTNFRVNALLSGTAIVKNLLLNVMRAAYADVETITSGTIDAAVSTVTLGRVARTRYVSEIIPVLKGQFVGARKSLKPVVNMLFAPKNITDEELGAIFDLGAHVVNVWDTLYPEGTKEHDWLVKAGYLLNAPLRLMMAGDLILRSAYQDQWYMQTAHRLVLRKGTKFGGKAYNDAMKKEVETLIASPEAKEQAKVFAAEGVFMGKAGKLLSALKGMRNIGQVAFDKSNIISDEELAAMSPGKRFAKILARTTPEGGLDFALKTFVPFIHTLGKVFEWSFNRIPLVGLATNRADNPMDIAARQVSGLVTAALILWILDDDDEERIIGALPKNKAEREAFWRAGKRPWSIDLFGNGVFISIENDPLHLPLKAAMIVKKAMEEAEDFETKAELFMSLGHDLKEMVVDSSFVENVLKGATREGEVWRQLRRIPASFIPASGLFRAASRTYEAATQGFVKIKDRDLPQDFVYPDALRQLLPGASKDLPDRLNVWGEAVHMPTSVPAEWLPYKWWSIIDDGFERELARLDLYPGMLRDQVTVGGKKVKLPTDLHRQHVVYYGQQLKKALSDLMGMRGYQKASDELKVKMLDRVRGRMQSLANRKMQGEILRNYRELLQ